MLVPELFCADVPLYLTDGGIETTLIFHNGFDLPEFAAFPLLETAEGRKSLNVYYKRYIDIARCSRSGFILETPTWRASQKWADLLGYDDVELCHINTHAVVMMHALRAQYATAGTPMLVSGCIGPQDDGYQPGDRMSAMAASTYHNRQVHTFKKAGVDLVTAITMTYPEEAVGIANAAASADLPVVIAFTVETDGRLPIGVTLQEAIEQVDREANIAPVHYMINCAHPDHFNLSTGEPWLERIGGLRANASRMSHAELDEAVVLDDGNPAEFGQQHRALRGILPNLRVIGGCCGTDHRHVEAVAQAFDVSSLASRRPWVTRYAAPGSHASLPGTETELGELRGFDLDQ